MQSPPCQVKCVAKARAPMAQQAGVAFYVAPFAFLTRHHEIVATTILVLQVLGVFRKKSCLPSPGLGIAQATEAAGVLPQGPHSLRSSIVRSRAGASVRPFQQRESKYQLL